VIPCAVCRRDRDGAPLPVCASSPCTCPCHAELFALRAALREALDGWERRACGTEPVRIDELRAALDGTPAPPDARTRKAAFRVAPETLAEIEARPRIFSERLPFAHIRAVEAELVELAKEHARACDDIRATAAEARAQALEDAAKRCDEAARNVRKATGSRDVAEVAAFTIELVARSIRDLATRSA
jgi:hypothetical protein